MGILLLTSTVGSPGVTTLAVGLALTWPRSVLLVDADAGAHQAVLAGFLAGQSAGGKGLLRVAEAHRDRRTLSEVVLDQTITLADGGDHRRLFLPGFIKPGSANLFSGVWPDLAEALVRLEDVGIDVIVDLGRISGPGLPPALVERATLTGLVVRTTLRSVLSARVHMPALLERAGNGPAQQLGLVTVGHGEPYEAREVGRSLGLPVLSVIAADPVPAAHLSDGRPRNRRFDSSPLVRSLQEAATAMARRMDQTADRIGAQA